MVTLFKNKKLFNIFFIIVFVLLFLLSRLPGLSTDVINPDGVNWHYRSEQFINGIKYLQFEKTYQHYHPGVTLMWITGVPIEITKILFDQKVYTNDNFLIFDSVAKYSLVFVQLLLSIFAICLLSNLKVKYLNILTSVLVVSLFSFEPFFIGNSRLYHLDILLTLFSFNALLLSYMYLNNIDLLFIKKNYVGILAGLFLALSFLTKSIGIGLLVFILFYCAALYILKRSTIDTKKLLILFISAFLFIILLFPALWKNPIYYLTEIFSESERVGVRKGHEQIILGEETTNAGLYFYPLVLLLKVSPFLLFSFIFYFFKKLDIKILIKNFSSFEVFMGLFYLGYFIVMLLPTKKVDRYMLVIYPALALYSFIFLHKLYLKWKNKFIYILIFLYILFIGYPLIYFYPYYFTYFSPLFLNATNAHNVIAQKPFGVGIYDLRNFILDNYGNVNLGFIDVKPIETIYPSSKVFDIRVEGTGKYDLLILGPNEVFPDKVLDSSTKFIKDKSFYINGLEYWRIYKKVL